MTTTLGTTPPGHAAGLLAAGVVAAPQIRRVRYEPDPGDGHSAPPLQLAHTPGPPVVAAHRPELGAVHTDLQRVLRLALEVLDGRRSLTHLRDHFAPPVLRYWRAATTQRSTRSPARIIRMRLCSPRPGAAEVAAVCMIDGRVRALAARFEQPAGATPGWRCTAIRLG